MRPSHCGPQAIFTVVVFQSLSGVEPFATPWTAAHWDSLSFTISQNFLKLMPIDLMMPSNHLILYHPPLFLPSVFPRSRVFSNQSALHIRWPKHWSFSLSISPSNEYSRLISFRIDWFDLLAVQGTLKNLPQHHSSKHQFFGLQPVWHPAQIFDPSNWGPKYKVQGIYLARLCVPSPTIIGIFSCQCKAWKVEEQDYLIPFLVSLGKGNKGWKLRE